jgi:rubrerythrin
MSVTIKNLESALLVKVRAFIKYKYFAKLARANDVKKLQNILNIQQNKKFFMHREHLELLNW